MSNHHNKFPALSDKISDYYYKTENLLSEATSRDYYGLASRIVYRTKCGILVCNEYDSNDLCVHYYDDNEIEYWNMYDSSGNKIYYKCYNREIWYDVDGKLISKETYIENHRNDTRPRCIFEDDTVWWNEYDTQGNLVYQINNEDNVVIQREYDSNRNEVHYKSSRNEYEEWSDYDENNNKIYHRTTNGNEWWCTYNSSGNKIHWKNIQGDEHWYNDDGHSITKKEYKKLHNYKFDCADDCIDMDNLVHEFQVAEIKKAFSVGDLIIDIHDGTRYLVYTDAERKYQPFAELNDYDPTHYRDFTQEELEEGRKRYNDLITIKNIFSDGDYVIAMKSGNELCKVYTDSDGDCQPFTTLDDYDHTHYRIATAYEMEDEDEDLHDDTDGLQRYNDVAVDELFNRFNHTSSATDIPTSMKSVGDVIIKKYTYTTLDNGIIKGEMKSTENDDIVSVCATVDDNGNVISFKNSDGTSGNNTYDDNGNMIFSTHSNGYTEWNIYDDQNRLAQKIHTQKD